MGRSEVLFTVIIPTYNRPELLIRAVESVISQGRRDTEILIVDDGSDAPYPYLNHFLYESPIRIIHKSIRSGASASRNTGVQEAKGEWLVFLDDDDEFAGGYLNRIENHIASNSICSVFWTGARIRSIKNGGVSDVVRVFPEAYSSTKLLIKDFLSVGLGFGICLNRRVLFDVGLFDESFHIGEDTELFFRLVSSGYIPKAIPGIGVLKHEEHDNRLSGDYKRYSDENIYNRIFDKHRNGFCKEWRYNYAHLLMWSYRLHRMYGNLASAKIDLKKLVTMGIPEAHISECYSSGGDLSGRYV